MRDGRTDFALIPAAQHNEFVYNRQNCEERKYIDAARKQEVQSVNHGDDKLRTDFRALLYEQDVDNAVD